MLYLLIHEGHGLAQGSISQAHGDKAPDGADEDNAQENAQHGMQAHMDMRTLPQLRGANERYIAV